MTHILVTNDDGVHAPGIQALAAALRDLGDVEIAAPAINQSASGHKRTVFQDIAVEAVTLENGMKASAIHGSPADCIALAALGVVTWPPRIVVSGINRGQNMGQDITTSGTVSAALEASLHGIPAVAVSLAKYGANTVAEYELAAEIAKEVVRHVLIHSLPPFTILNLNVPPTAFVKGIRLTRQGVSEYEDALEHDEAANTYKVLWMTNAAISGKTDEPGTDMWAVHNGYASLTPIHLDMTAHRLLAELSAWDITLPETLKG